MNIQAHTEMFPVFSDALNIVRSKVSLMPEYSILIIASAEMSDPLMTSWRQILSAIINAMGTGG